MAWRWKILLAVGLSIAAADQLTKFLAVRDLTPLMAQALAAESGRQPEDVKPEELGQLGLGKELAYFYGPTRKPCHQPGARCTTSVVIPGFWQFTYAENPGAAWSLLASSKKEVRVPFFVAVSLGAIGFILWLFRRISDQQRLLIAALSLVFGGAIGNFIDRIRLNYVIDFIVWFIGSYQWPTFNVADSAISVGVVLLLADALIPASRRTAAPVSGQPG